MKVDYTASIFLSFTVFILTLILFLINFYWLYKVKKIYNQVKDQNLKFNFNENRYSNIKLINIFSCIISLCVLLIFTILKFKNLLNKSFLYEWIIIGSIICEFIMFMILAYLISNLIFVKTEKYLVIVNRLIDLRSVFKIEISKRFIKVIYINAFHTKSRFWFYNTNNLDQWFETHFKELIRKDKQW
ncbi:hypothetical protein [Mycoplasma capricolum]|uniref:Membrane protein n=3 Tax=Mycoplasma capricolum subsp. capricolum TaxID=40479 RepID=A0A0C2ZZT7_MYCCA|nr:hypothetical protein [Mycoplasma capricolum]ABC01651.1 membrane protein, putative [Mycoplasma capricolum subsp. capricolum ATCC 27343]KEZ20514.1 hypothetical protein MCAPa_0900 [Mycoplasma capricolum subsp. capricolum 14232]KIM13549.1 membrane protein [Mycoplasma capricolum subsp. capricolum]KKW61547.1 putative transmembrane protein [Mycoplasma capricolum subsp. capricolum]